MFVYPKEVVDLIEKGQKLDAIKTLKEMKGLSLNVAKDLVNNYNPNKKTNCSTHDTLCKYDNAADFFRYTAPDSCWKSGCDLYDSVILPNDDIKFLVRLNFNIPDDEEILYVRDTSFWSNKNQGLVLTDKSIRLIPDNEHPNDGYIIPLSKLNRAEYKELQILLFLNNGSSIPIHISNFIKNADIQRNLIGDFLGILLTKMASMEEDPVEIIKEKYRRIEENNGHKSAIQFAEEQVATDSNAACLYVELAKECLLKEDYERLADYCNKGINVLPKDGCEYLQLIEMRGHFYEKSGYYSLSRKDFYLAYNLSTEDMMCNYSDDTLESVAEKSFWNSCSQLSEHILDQPYNERKVIMPVRTFSNVDEIETFTMLHIDDKTGIDYPTGHPIANHLYVGHPYLAKKYMPFETYQLELVEDRVREFCYLVQCLGATEISIDCLTSSNSKQHDKSKIDINATLESEYVDVKTGISGNTSTQMIEELSRSISLHQTFSPNQKPFLPQDLIWYSNEPSWQRLYVQRMNGGLTSHEEHIETRKSQMVSSSELSKLKSDIDTLYVGLNMEISAEEKNKYNIQENATLSIKVKFAPIKEIQEDDYGTNVNFDNTCQQFTEKEKEYLNEYKECLSENDNIIGNGERRLLDRFCKQLGITEKRKIEIESYVANMVTPINDEEKEYLEEVKACLAEGGNISDGERRLLNKWCKRLGITPKRAEELEHSIIS